MQVEADRSEQQQSRDDGANPDGRERDEAFQVGCRHGGAHRHAARLQHDGAGQALADDVEQELAREVAKREGIDRGAALHRHAQCAEGPFEAQKGEQKIEGEQDGGEPHGRRPQLVKARSELAEIDRDEDQRQRDSGRDTGQDRLQPAHRWSWPAWHIIGGICRRNDGSASARSLQGEAIRLAVLLRLRVVAFERRVERPRSCARQGSPGGTILILLDQRNSSRRIEAENRHRDVSSSRSRLVLTRGPTEPGALPVKAAGMGGTELVAGRGGASAFTGAAAAWAFSSSWSTLVLPDWP